MIKANAKTAMRAAGMLFVVLFLASCGRTAGIRNSSQSKKPYACEWQSQNPEDGAHVEPGSEFDIIWTLYNAGSKEWTTDFGLRYFAGINLTKPGKSRYSLNAPIAPGTAGECSLDAVAPWEPGEYMMVVVLSDENDDNFCKVDVTIVVDELEEK